MSQCGDKPRRIAFGIAPLGIEPMGVVSNGLLRMARLLGRSALLETAVAALAQAPAAWAHADAHPGGGFVAGFLHPVSGLDHVVAMVAVGLW